MIFHSSLIHSLFSASCPSAIPWLIVAVIVDAVQRQIRGGLEAHISQKVLKSITPFLANGNSATAIAIIMGGFRFIAPLNHVLPCAVFARYFPAHRVAVFFRILRSKATTANNSPASQVASPDDFTPPAIAQAVPSRLEPSVCRTLICRGLSRYYQAAKPLIGKVHKGHNPFILSHFHGLPA